MIDTNVLCRLVEKGHAHHVIAESAVTMLRDDNRDLCLVPQVLYEYWVVAMRPVAENGLGMTPSLVDRAVELWTDWFTLLRDKRGVFSICASLSDNTMPREKVLTMHAS